MSIDLLSKTQEICRLFKLKPSRSKGQNFLVSEEAYEAMIESADLSLDDVALEVGPGLGFLTAKLARKAKRVIAVELDDDLASFLKTAIDSENIDNVEIVNQDILKFDQRILPAGYKIVANLPYNITSFFLRLFLSSNNKPSLAVLMLQKEVAERIVAAPGEMSLLALSVQYYADAEIRRLVPAADFWPKPEVDSAIIRLRLKTDFLLAPEKEKAFFRFAKFGFSAKRKMLKNNLSGALNISSAEAGSIITASGLDLKVRAEDLSLADWLKLFVAFSDFVL